MEVMKKDDRDIEGEREVVGFRNEGKQMKWQKQGERRRNDRKIEKKWIRGNREGMGDKHEVCVRKKLSKSREKI